MGQAPVTRKEFLDATAAAGAGVLLSAGGTAAPGACAECSQVTASGDAPCETAAGALRLRPYQLLCLICSMDDAPEPKAPKLKELLGRIRRDPETPLALCCNAGDVYVYQDPGTADDTPEGRDYNRKRDLDILQRLDAPPGATHPARTWLAMLLKGIPSVAGLCAYPAVTSEAWKGCARAGSGSYERARTKGLNALIPPRNEAEMARDKQAAIPGGRNRP